MTDSVDELWLWADWPAPQHIRAGTSIRKGGSSKAPYNELNLATHVGDITADVIRNRNNLSKHLELPNEPSWLEQTHSSKIISLDHHQKNSVADGSYTSKKNNICAILTADCVPILFCNSEGTKIAAIHAGWKGICAGIIENAIKEFAKPNSTLVWIGPCIGRQYYQVGRDVYEQCLDYSDSLKSAFQQINNEHWYCDLSNIVKIILRNSEVGLIYECGLCTYKSIDLFYSYRRENNTGRTASMIWME
ncbi:MAG: laccase domain protein [marine bacterium B5-7]|nr:MAG: laccase domain protein [marine bacterium B5-7]